MSRAAGDPAAQRRRERGRAAAPRRRWGRQRQIRPSAREQIAKRAVGRILDQRRDPRAADVRAEHPLDGVKRARGDREVRARECPSAASARRAELDQRGSARSASLSRRTRRRRRRGAARRPRRAAGPGRAGRRTGRAAPGGRVGRRAATSAPSTGGRGCDARAAPAVGDDQSALAQDPVGEIDGRRARAAAPAPARARWAAARRRRSRPAPMPASTLAAIALAVEPVMR